MDGSFQDVPFNEAPAGDPPAWLDDGPPSEEPRAKRNGKAPPPEPPE